MAKVLTIIFWELHSFLHQPRGKIQVFFSKKKLEMSFIPLYKIIMKGIRGYRIFLRQALANSLFSAPDKIAKPFVILWNLREFFLKVLFIFTEQMQLASNKLAKLIFFFFYFEFSILGDGKLWKCTPIAHTALVAAFVLHRTRIGKGAMTKFGINC